MNKSGDLACCHWWWCSGVERCQWRLQTVREELGGAGSWRRGGTCSSGGGTLDPWNFFFFLKKRKRMMVAVGFALYKADLWRFWKRNFWWWWKRLMWRKWFHRMELTRLSFRALIPCRKPKFNRNNNGEKYNWEIERERKRIEARVFQVVQLCEPTITWCSQWATSLLIHCV